MVDVFLKNHTYYAVDYDECADSPREMFSNLGTILTYAKEYSPDYYNGDFRDKVRMVYGSTKITKGLYQNRNYIAFPVYILSHSGVYYSMNDFNDPWDSGLAGFIYATRERIRKWFGVTKITKRVIDSLIAQFQNELEEYTTYVNGGVLFVSMYTFEDGFLNLEDSCGGFFDIDCIYSEFGFEKDNFYGEFYSIAEFENHLHHKHDVDRNSGVE